ncbi:Type II secretion system protein G [Aquicella siphonis]|uniref:Type II secretion system protein G n=1 Tax=Aquicella siphonis TaxID=254247 RepID=A0A5E4PIS7_9COXI|nr:type II secretion system major pseudopilin GspG [Aquicella siphonis]VVC76282.1 Type II secretion system protein G [Aquicella siphonis]
MLKMRGLGLVWFILIVVVLAVAAVFVAPHILGSSQKEEIKKVRTDFSSLYDALEQYRLDNGAYPTTAQGLQALIIEPTTSPVPRYWKQGGYMNALPMDPWDQPYQYSNNLDVIRVYSYGPGGEKGGTEIDITNIDKQ